MWAPTPTSSWKNSLFKRIRQPTAVDASFFDNCGDLSIASLAKNEN